MMTYPEQLHFRTAGQMCRFIERRPEVLVTYQPTDHRPTEQEIKQTEHLIDGNKAGSDEWSPRACPRNDIRK